MKRALTLLTLITLSLSAFAADKEVKSLPQTKAQIDLSEVATSQVLAKNDTNGRKIIAVTLDSGASTDLYDRYTTYLVFQQYTEMRNIRTAFKLGTSFTLPELTRSKAGIYTFKGTSAESGKFDYSVVTYGLYEDLANLEATLGDFEDTYLNTSIMLLDFTMK